MQVRRTVTSTGDPIIELTTANDRIVLGPGDGEILLQIEAADTEALPTSNRKQTWVYDLEMVPGSGEVDRLVQGKFVVLPNVTRA